MHRQLYKLEEELTHPTIDEGYRTRRMTLEKRISNKCTEKVRSSLSGRAEKKKVYIAQIVHVDQENSKRGRKRRRKIYLADTVITRNSLKSDLILNTLFPKAIFFAALHFRNA